MTTVRALEAILFVATKPLSIRALAKALSVTEVEVEEALRALREMHNPEKSGIVLLEEGGVVRLATHPEYAALVDQFYKDEVQGELTKAQLETLTVVAYRGPVTRPEIEEIRGVNCAIILRTLLMRGLIDEVSDDTKFTNVFRLSHEALRHLGIARAEDLPDYETLHAHPHVEALLQADTPPREPHV